MSQKRIGSDYQYGGLNIYKPKHQSFFIWFTSFINILKHANLFSNSNISIILRYKHVPITSIFQDFGIKTLVTYKKSFKCLYPKTNNNYFSLACEFLKKLENDPKYCLYSSICQSSFSKQCNFDRADIDILTNNNLVTVSSVLRYNFDEKKKENTYYFTSFMRSN